MKNRQPTMGNWSRSWWPGYQLSVISSSSAGSGNSGITRARAPVDRRGTRTTRSRLTKGNRSVDEWPAVGYHELHELNSRMGRRGEA